MTIKLIALAALFAASTSWAAPSCKNSNVAGLLKKTAAVTVVKSPTSKTGQD